MSHITVDGIENAVRKQEFMQRVAKAANDHMRITEPEWDLYDVKVATHSVALGRKRVAVTLYFQENGLGF